MYKEKIPETNQKPKPASVLVDKKNRKYVEDARNTVVVGQVPNPDSTFGNFRVFAARNRLLEGIVGENPKRIPLGVRVFLECDGKIWLASDDTVSSLNGTVQINARAEDGSVKISLNWSPIILEGYNVREAHELSDVTLVLKDESDKPVLVDVAFKSVPEMVAVFEDESGRREERDIVFKSCLERDPGEVPTYTTTFVIPKRDFDEASTTEIYGEFLWRTCST